MNKGILESYERVYDLLTFETSMRPLTDAVTRYQTTTESTDPCLCLSAEA